MSWQDGNSRFWRFGGIGRPYPYPSPELHGINEQCFIRKEHKCGKIFGASKSCFIACPNDVELEIILELMSEKLGKVGIESIIAIKERAYGQDIFCTKICGKIIESKFCIVVLDDTIKDGKNIPNPNVYYEYGLMTALKKHIIPLQKSNLVLAFNIQSYDTVKYTSSNIASELDRAIREAIRIIEPKVKDEAKLLQPNKTILRGMELAGFELKDEKWFLSEVIDDTNFKGFGKQGKFYLYLGKIDEKSELDDYLEDTHIVLYRTEKSAQGLKEELQGYKKTKIFQEKKIAEEKSPLSVRQYQNSLKQTEGRIKDAESKLVIMNKIFFGFLINPEIDATNFSKKIKSIIKKHSRYKFIYGTDSEIKIDGIKVSLLNFDSQ